MRKRSRVSIINLLGLALVLLVGFIVVLSSRPQADPDRSSCNASFKLFRLISGDHEMRGFNQSCTQNTEPKHRTYVFALNDPPCDPYQPLPNQGYSCRETGTLYGEDILCTRSSPPVMPPELNFDASVCTFAFPGSGGSNGNTSNRGAFDLVLLREGKPIPSNVKCGENSAGPPQVIKRNEENKPVQHRCKYDKDNEGKSWVERWAYVSVTEPGDFRDPRRGVIIPPANEPRDDEKTPQKVVEFRVTTAPSPSPSPSPSAPPAGGPSPSPSPVTRCPTNNRRLSILSELRYNLTFHLTRGLANVEL